MECKPVKTKSFGSVITIILLIYFFYTNQNSKSQKQHQNAVSAHHTLPKNATPHSIKNPQSETEQVIFKQIQSQIENQISTAYSAASKKDSSPIANEVNLVDEFSHPQEFYNF
jgi:hypothetical protein